ncbi:DUF4232 domain-containing protein [Streptomyces sp. NRRL B-24085]|uniref:DUF4232 domain-containing protein n=1 Tax=Streptomyces sp. NRRL B-24085 TaxID=1709476 RepID=UPI0006B3529E|nr:DUF4232 domain-containing protein [Streptomyces sp. NRRL B-24085]
MSKTSRARLLTAAASTVLAALSLTACNDGTGTQDEGRAAGTSPSATASSPGAAPDSPAPSTTTDQSASTGSTGSSATTGSSGTGSGGGGGTSTARTPVSKAPAGKPVTCEGSVTRTVAAPLTRPVNHMLLTVTNTGSKTCYLYGYPAVRFGEAQSVPPVIEASQPQAVVTLAPGESGYASVNLSATDGSAANGHTVKSLAVYFHGRSGSESVGTGARPSLPAKGVYVDDSLAVTYWQQSMDDAVSW